MKRHTIAAVIPVYNAEAYIDETLNSVAKQFRSPEQIVVINDGSTDQTMERILDWDRQRGPRLTIIEQSNKGVSTARNRGIEHCQADLIAFLDADDLWLPPHLEQLARAFENHDLTVCFADALHFDDLGTVRPSSLASTLIEQTRFHKQEDDLRLMIESPYCSLLNGNYISLSSSLISKKALERTGGFDPAIKSAEDRDLFLRLSRIGRFAYYPRVLAHKRQHFENLTHPRRLMSSQHYPLIVLRKMLAHAEECELSEIEARQTRTALANHIQTMLYHASCRGLGPYLKTCGYLMRQREILAVCRPRHFVRSLVSVVDKPSFDERTRGDTVSG